MTLLAGTRQLILYSRIRHEMFSSRLRQHIHSWTQNIPLPTFNADTRVFFQEWHEFDGVSQRWRQVDTSSSDKSAGVTSQHEAKLGLATWNVDAMSKMPRERLSAILSRLEALAPAPDVVFFQEVSHSGLAFLLHDERVRERWFTSETSARNWGAQAFGTVTLISRRRFSGKGSDGRARLGAVWRVRYPSRFGRDALCCDVFMGGKRVRFINVHLDSLQIEPSLRPAQLGAAASALRSAGQGVVAGDFNPVGKEDEGLVGENGLADAWRRLRPGEDGWTWGVDGKKRFPPGRFDRVAMLGMTADEIEVMHPGIVELAQEGDGKAEKDEKMVLPWSDHSGVRCCIRLGD